ncbi:MAG: hypothetical protein HON70_41595, partial [Lentisphaerae bacterium]|nr:hypothetical protein [Lentisphaerota bacterium]
MTTLNAIACVVLTGTCVFPAVSYAGDDGHPAGAPRMGTGIKAAPNDSRVSLCGVVDDNRVLVDFATDHPAIESVRATVHKGDVLNVTFRKPSGFVRISAPEAGWNLNAYVAVAVDLENNGSTSLTIKGKINRKDRPSSLVHLEPGQADTMLLYLSVKGRGKRFGAMSGAPGGDIHFWGGYDKPLVMRSLELGDLDGQAVGGRVAVKAIRAVGKRMALHPPGDDFFPFVDAFGQYRHQTWTNKVHSVDQLKDHGRREIASIRAYPRCPGWSRFGGWARGPRLAGTGHFRTQEHDGRWWFVDPEGYLFWSIGSNGVRFGVGTRVKGREHYFASIPDEGKKTGYVDFSRVNMQLKYGETWRAVYIGLCHDRLSSWGMNSCGNWSDPQVYLERRTPYVVAVNLGEKHGEAAAVIRGNEAVLQKTLRRQLAKHARSAEDPWCIGYFIDNELSWKFVPDIDMYFRIVREEMRVAAPNKLYLGSRIHDRNPEA